MWEVQENPLAHLGARLGHHGGKPNPAGQPAINTQVGKFQAVLRDIKKVKVALPA